MKKNKAIKSGDKAFKPTVPAKLKPIKSGKGDKLSNKIWRGTGRGK